MQEGQEKVSGSSSLPAFPAFLSGQSDYRDGLLAAGRLLDGALEVLEGHFPEGSTIRVGRTGDELTFSTADGNSERPGA